MTPLAISMAPLDWGLCGAAVLLAIFAARTFVTGQGQAQMGLGFMLVSAVVGTFAIGRQIDGFDTVDGVRLSVGVLLLVPVFRVLFTHTGSSVTTAVVSLILASVIGGPVVARAFPEHVETDVPYEIMKVKGELARIDAELDSTRGTRDSIINAAAFLREKIDALGIEDAEALQANEEALDLWADYKRYSERKDSLQREIDALKRHKASVEARLSALEKGAEDPDALARAERIRQEIEDADAAESLKTDAEKYADRAELIEFFEAEVGAEVGAGK